MLALAVLLHRDSKCVLIELILPLIFIFIRAKLFKILAVVYYVLEGIWFFTNLEFLSFQLEWSNLGLNEFLNYAGFNPRVFVLSESWSCCQSFRFSFLQWVQNLLELCYIGSMTRIARLLWLKAPRLVIAVIFIEIQNFWIEASFMFLWNFLIFSQWI